MAIPLSLLRQMHKAELHVHLDGSVRISTLIELAQEQGVVLPSYDCDELKRHIAATNCASLEEHLKGFDITLSVLQESYAITRVAYEICEDAKLDGVQYIEIRFAPLLHIKNGLNLSQVMNAILRGQALAERKLGVSVRISVCAMRQSPPSVNIQLAGMAWRYQDNGVCGFDMAGLESVFSTHDHKEAFRIIRDRCLNVTVHTGEGEGWENIEDSILSCGVTRISHGTKLIQNRKLVQVVANRHIAIECCVTSDLLSKAISSIDAHPIRTFFDEGIVVVPSVENWTVCDATLSEEYDVIQRNFKFDYVEIVRMIDNSFAATFLEPTHKSRLRTDALRFNLELLQKHGYDINPILNHIQFYPVLGPIVTPTTFSNFIGTIPYGMPYGDDPPITLDIVRALPKADLHCTLVGSVSPKVVWDGLENRSAVLKKYCERDFATVEDFCLYWDHCDLSVTKSLTQEALQTPDYLRAGVLDVLQKSLEDGVIYLELAVRPTSLCQKQMTESQVVEVVLDAFKEFKSKTTTPFWCGLLLCVSTTHDDPVAAGRLADLAIQYIQDGALICGMGFYGHQEIPANGFQYYKGVFARLNKNYVPVAIQAGQSDERNVLPALHEGGAQRLSGAFMIHRHPRLMAYIASHSIPIELGITDEFEHMKKNSWSISGNPIRLLLDNGIPVTVCGFRRTKSVSEEVFDVVRECQLTAAETLTLMLNSVRYNFQSSKIREAMAAHVRETAAKVMEEKGFQYFSRRSWTGPGAEVSMRRLSLSLSMVGSDDADY